MIIYGPTPMDRLWTMDYGPSTIHYITTFTIFPFTKMIFLGALPSSHF